MNIYLKYLLIALVTVIIALSAYYLINKINTPEITTEESGESDQPIFDQNYDTDSTNDQSDNYFSQNNLLKITALSLSVPITINVDGNNMEEYMKALEVGVDHLKGTALPGESGNVVIFGHSSYYQNKPGEYKDIFSNLDKLNNGDSIEITYQGETYSYSVTKKEIVYPNKISVVDQDYSQKSLTLITCWPVGTADKRLVVSAILE